MSAISEITQRVYDSKEFSVKGYSISLKDTFVYRRKKQL